MGSLKLQLRIIGYISLQRWPINQLISEEHLGRQVESFLPSAGHADIVIVGETPINNRKSVKSLYLSRQPLPIQIAVIVGLDVPDSAITAAPECHDLPTLCQNSRMNSSGHDFDDWGVEFIHEPGHWLVGGVGMRPFAEVAQLALVAGAPRVDPSIHCRCHAVCIFLAPSARYTFNLYLFKCLYQSGSLNIIFIAMSKLVEVALSPRVDLPLLADSQSMCETCIYSSKQYLPAYSFKLVQVVFVFMAMETVMPCSIHLSLIGYDDSE